MLTIKQHDDAWRLRLDGEEWEFDDEEKLFKVLGFIVGFKRDYGKLLQYQKKMQVAGADAKTETA